MMRSFRFFPFRAACILVLSLVVLPGAAAADVIQVPGAKTISVAGVVFQKTLQVQGSGLGLAGAGLHRYRIVFKGYAAALYLGMGNTPEKVFEEIPKHLEIEYFHAIPAQDFIDATREGLERNVSRAGLDRMKPQMERLFRTYRHVKPGDRYVFTYMPGGGSTLMLNGERLAIFEGLDFANAFLSIWVGRNPIDEGLKRALLGRP
jgi:hypothetical protein